jgi:hypothetical protein
MNESLVDRVSKTIVEHNDNYYYSVKSCAVIREVAAWLREYRGDEVTAKILEEEADV